MRLPHALRDVARLRKLANNPRFRRWLFPIAGLVFLAITIFSFSALPDGQRITRAYLLPLLVIVGAPVNVLVLAAEFKVMANAVDQRVPMMRAVRVTLAASIANYLPAPGGVAVRTVAMRQQGSTVRSALKANAVVGMVWIGVAGVAAGCAFLAGMQRLGEGAAFLAGGLAFVIAAVIVVHLTSTQRSRMQTYRVTRKIMLVEAVLVATATVRIWLCLAVVGELAPVGTAVAISTSGVAAAAIGILPAGLGIKEVIAGGLGALLGIPAAVAIAATAIDRVTRQLGTALFAMAMGIRRQDLGGEEPEAGDGDEPGGSGSSGGDSEVGGNGSRKGDERTAEQAGPPTTTELQRST